MKISPNLRGYALAAGLLLSGSAFGAANNYFDQGLVHYSLGEYPLALESFQKAAAAGESGADYMLMKMHSEGHGAQSAAAAFQWAQQAAQNNLAQAQYQLAQMYARGEGTAVDQKQAFLWFEKAARQYHPLAIQQLARYYETGLGIAKNTEQANRWYAIAASELDVYAQKGDPNSQNRLAAMYEQGQGVSTNPVIAMGWYRKAALQGMADAQYNLGRLLAYGAIEKNVPEAVYWLRLAANSGHKDAGLMLAKLTNPAQADVAFAD